MPPQDPGRRTSTRTTRTINRPDNYYVPYRDMATGRPSKSSGPNFFPALAHFSDSITALPKELIKHFSMLKEVEAKACDPEKSVQNILQEIERLAVPTKAQSYQNAQSQTNVTGTNSVAGSIAGSVHQDPVLAHQHLMTELYPANFESLPAEQQAALYRRQLFLRLRHTIGSMLPTLDEKIVVLSSANQTLQKGLTRMDSSYKHLGEEISDEARFGSASHWAYTDLREEKKKAAANERSRREIAAANNLAAAAAAVHDSDLAASRSELRREAMLAKKGRNHHNQNDSDFDERAPVKRTNASKNVKKAQANVRKATAGDSKAQGLGISNIPGQTNKRRRVDKEDASAPGMERSLSGALAQAARGGASSPRETPTAEPAKKRAKAAPGLAPNKRAIAASVQSPQLAASSPLVGSFTPKDLAPAPRPTSSRVRTNSVTNVNALPTSEPMRIRPESAASNRPLNGMSITAHELEQAAAATSIAVPPAVETPPISHVPVPLNIVSLKQEELEASSQDAGESSTPITTRAGRISKASTPIQPNFPESVPMGRSRSTRNNANNNGGGSHASSESGAPSAATNPTAAPKRSHKKNGSISAAAAAAFAHQPATIASTKRAAKVRSGSDDTSSATTSTTGAATSGPASTKPTTKAKIEDRKASLANVPAGLEDSKASNRSQDEVDEDEDDDEDDDEADEKRYCICGGVSFGEMVGCDNDNCDREWFHLECVGLTKAPAANEKWYCMDCKRKGFGGGVTGGGAGGVGAGRRR